jgi:hypothetical protein
MAPPEDHIPKLEITLCKEHRAELQSALNGSEIARPRIVSADPETGEVVIECPGTLRTVSITGEVKGRF